MLDQLWRIELMGGLRLCRGKEVITHFKSRKVAALLAYLAFYGARHHAREELQALMWPEDGLDAARNSLRVALSLLRRQLEPSEVPPGSVLYADRSSVWLNPDSIITDTSQFDARYAAALHTEDDADQAALLLEAAETYHGELLTGYYDEWVLSERSRLNETYLQAMRKLVRSLAATRDYERALEFARKAVHLDPLREEATRDLMRLFLAVHQPTAALQQYRDLETRLKQEFQSRPAAATRELARRIAEGLDDAGVPGSGNSPKSYLQPITPLQNDTRTDDTRPALGARIPVALTRFFGREQELAKLSDWAVEISRDTVTAEQKSVPRLITLTGMGGTGKTRLATQLVENLDPRLKERIWFVPLAELPGATHIADAIADSLQIPRTEFSELPERISSRLNGSPALVILDNFEHLIDGGTPLVRLLLEQTPLLYFLVTSRRRLGIKGEQEFPLLPLPVPVTLVPGPRTAKATGLDPVNLRSSGSQNSLTALTNCAAIQLFVDRAQAVDSSFCLTANNAPGILSLCRQLDGLPLALELAAARIRVLTPDQMLTYVSRRLDLLIDPHAEKDGRHRSLRAAIEWSFRLLSPSERRLFARLSLFEGGWTLAAASNICAEPDILEALEQLRINSLIQADVYSGEVRFRMLETLRSFAAEQLSAEDRKRFRPRHAQYFLSLAEEAEPNVKGPDEAKWMDLLQVEHDNLGAALECFAADPSGGESGLRMIRALWRFWSGRGYLTEGRERTKVALDHPGAQETTANRARALMYGGDLANSQSDFAAAEQLFDRSLAAFRAIGNLSGEANALSRLGLVKMRAGQYGKSRQLQQESLEMHEAAGDTEGIATSSSYLGLLAVYLGDYHLARSCNERCLAIYRNMGSRRNLAMTLGNLGLIAEHLGEYSAARGLQEESLSIHRELGTQQGVAASLSNLAIILIKLGERDDGKRRLLEGMSLFREIGNKHSVVISLDTLASLATSDQEWQTAAWLFGVADGARGTMGAVLPPRDQQERDRDFALLKERMGEEAFYLEFTKGSATEMEVAIHSVLEDNVLKMQPS